MKLIFPLTFTASFLAMWSCQVVASEDPALSTPADLREILAAHGVIPLDPAPPRDEALVTLGQALFFDPDLSSSLDSDGRRTLASGRDTRLRCG
jgi:cytochrome c peroxidase